jgi:inosine-uridine nucleoside N-ribohydrolase
VYSSVDVRKNVIDIVLDTDTYNEVDDQFALAYAILSPERIKVEACYAAPFYADNSINDRSSSPVDGMEKSYHEIVRILKLMGQTEKIPVFRGSKNYLPNPSTPIESEAVDDLIKRAMSDRDAPLYVVAIAALTNVASAILKEPKIIDRIVVVWLGGHPYNWHTANEFNLMQDLAASQLIFNCGVPLVHVPCKNVAEHLRVSLPELKSCISGKSLVGDYLCEIFEGYQKDQR